MPAKKPTERGKFILRLSALFFSVIPPALAVLFYFPLWEAVSAKKLISGGVLFLLILTAVPIFKAVLARIKTPMSYMLWLFIFLLFYLTASIADEMIVIAFTGFWSNLIGALLFKLAGRDVSEK